MRMCSEIIVLRLDGWEISSGVAREIKFFHEHGRTVNYADPSTFGISDVQLADADKKVLK
jgi:hypothetical protein